MKGWEFGLFFSAMEAGDALVVWLMCEKLGSSITLSKTHGHYERTALIVASELGDVDVVDVLLEVDSSESHIAATDIDAFTALILASMNGHEAIVRKLLTHCPSSQHIRCHSSISDGSYSALMYASRLGHIDVVNVLLEFDDSSEHIILLTDLSLYTALMFACLYGQVNIVKRLLEVCCSRDHVLHYRNSSGESALFIACRNGRIEVLKVLLGIYESLGLDDDLDEAIGVCKSKDCERAVKEYQQKISN